MSRIEPLEVQHWDPELSAMAGADDATALQQVVTGVMAHSPEFAKASYRFGGAMLQHTRLPRRLVELVRLRVAFHNQCRTCMAIRYQTAVDAGLTEASVCSLERPPEAPDLSEAEKAAIVYADQSCIDHLSIDDRTFDALRRHFGEDQIVELGMFIAYYLGFGRLAASWDMVEELPAAFRDKSDRAAPWSGTGVQLPG